MHSVFSIFTRTVGSLVAGNTCFECNYIFYISILIIMKSTPAICGIDLGSWTFKLCAFNGDRFDILTNEANFRETPSLVGYTPTERLIGEPAIIKVRHISRRSKPTLPTQSGHHSD